MTVRFRDEALQDLEEIADYIARDNPAAAFAVVARPLRSVRIRRPSSSLRYRL